MLQHFDIARETTNKCYFSIPKRSYRRKWTLFPSIAIYFIGPISWNLTTRCLVVTGGGSIGECNRLTQPSGFWAHYNIVILTYLFECISNVMRIYLFEKYFFNELAFLVVSIRLPKTWQLERVRDRRPLSSV